VFRDFPTFSRICIFFLLTLSLLFFFLPIFLFSLPLPCSAFHLSILSEVCLLNVLRLNHSKPIKPPLENTSHQPLGFSQGRDRQTDRCTEYLGDGATVASHGIGHTSGLLGEKRKKAMIFCGQRSGNNHVFHG
jgi:hypothetical protein